MAEQQRDYGAAIESMVRSLINDLVTEGTEKGYGDTPRDQIQFHLRHGVGDGTMPAIAALGTYLQARATERQATATEALAKAVTRLERDGSSDVAGQAIIDERDSKRESLASTYSLPTDVLLLLWALRGMVVDASIRSLSRPDRFDPYRRVKTEEAAWALRMTPGQFVAGLPHGSDGLIDYGVLEAFDIMRYGGTDAAPDDWMYGG